MYYRSGTVAQTLIFGGPLTPGFPLSYPCSICVWSHPPKQPQSIESSLSQSVFQRGLLRLSSTFTVIWLPARYNLPLRRDTLAERLNYNSRARGHRKRWMLLLFNTPHHYANVTISVYTEFHNEEFTLTPL